MKTNKFETKNKFSGEQLASLEQRLSADMAALSSLLEVKSSPSLCTVDQMSGWVGFGWVWWVRKGDGSMFGGSVDSFQKKSPDKKLGKIVHLKTPNYPLSLGWKKNIQPPQIFQSNFACRNRYFQNENRFFNTKPIQESSPAPGSLMYISCSSTYVNILFSIGSK